MSLSREQLIKINDPDAVSQLEAHRINIETKNSRRQEVVVHRLGEFASDAGAVGPDVSRSIHSGEVPAIKIAETK